MALLVTALATVPATEAVGAPRRAPVARAPAAAPVPRAAPLLLPEVLASARFHAPQVIEALARVRGAEGRLLSAEAAFDTVFSANAETRVTGYYDGRYAETQVTQPLSDRGGYVYGGYRVSGGRFPIYEDERYTNQLGELKAGAVLSLMRDRRIDDRRFARLQAETDVVLADVDRVVVAIGVQARAIQAYNNWVFAGLRLRVYQDLLQLAQDRQAGFRRQVEEGARPTILLTENEQNILRRQSLVVQSEQALGVAAAALSLYLRDGDGTPIIVDPARLPDAPTPPLPLPAQPQELVLQRPDLRAIDMRMQQATQRLALDRNAFLPKLDVKVETSNDFGRVGYGGTSRNGVESKVGVTFTLPLQQRAARGRLAQTNAEIDAFRARRRFLEDQIMADIDGLGIAARSTARLVSLAADEADRAAEMAVAERRRFTLGASDYFLVNVREEAAADARVRRLDAVFRQAVAHADLAAATGDLDRLGL
ncbi:TolC family protein [Polymorphobacter fuscus]|uniref:Multidrug transporter n=1 Tax=Sandarakinorhabdus fusca TaxID=1439888 RepID=A0A7C9GTJ0_9SPHN|nr:TolC family protein [Polymorphobacter fuscus]KAB7643708.1 TolC family protein [Polymorphobacter fuscus]MQT18651.1 multidrug transporter [Polymorphobacter fuscus]NJC08133.1 outer membrane protein TolC [Polymorphobacter fuscus]